VKVSLILAMLVSPLALFAQERTAIRPIVELTEVSDNNLNDSDSAPIADRYHRLTSSLLMRYVSPRCSVRSTLSVDSERYTTYQALDDNRARTRGQLGLQCEPSSRLTLTFDGSYLDTNTLADLDLETGLASGRLHGRQFSGGPSMRYRISPLTALTASAAMLETDVLRGVSTSGQLQTIGIERRTSPHDTMRIEYQHGDATFDGDITQTVRSHVLLAGWTRETGPRTHWTLRGGPRVTDGQASVDAFASLSHDFHSSSLGLALSRTQTTVAGYSGAVQTESAELKLGYSPSRRVLAYAAPVWFRNSRDPYTGTVYRLSVGANWSMTSFLGLQAAWNFNRQQGGIDLARVDADFSRSIFTFGMTAGMTR
jgi:hypothetical protein